MNDVPNLIGFRSSSKPSLKVEFGDFRSASSNRFPRLSGAFSLEGLLDLVTGGLLAKPIYSPHAFSMGRTLQIGTPLFS